MTDALATIADDYREPQYHGRKSKPWGNVISPNLARAKVSRPTAKATKPKPAAEVAPTVAKPPSPIGRVVASYEGVVQAFRDRADQLEISRIELDRLTGLADAHCSMLLMKSPMKTPMKIFGPVSLPAMMAVLGLRFRIEEDPEQTALTLRRRERRVRTHVHYGLQFSPISGSCSGRLFGFPPPIAEKPNRRSKCCAGERKP
jgi:hypothetical protein